MPLINEKFPLSDKIHYSNQKLGKEWGIQIVGMLFQTRSNTDFFNPLLFFIATIQRVLFRKVLLRRN